MQEEKTFLGLATIRRNRGISLKQIAESTKISVRSLAQVHPWLLVTLTAAILAAGQPARSFAQQPQTPADPQPARTDRYGDPLPPGALARLGTIRWRPGRLVDLLAFAADGKLVVAREFFNGVFHVFNAANGKEVHRLGSAQYSSSILSQGGRFLACIGDRDRILQVWEIATGKELWKQTFGREGRGSEPVAFTADGRLLAIWEEEGRTISFRTTASGEQVGQVRMPSDRPASHWSHTPDVSFAPDGTTVATVGSDGILRIWKVPTGQLVRTLGFATASWAADPSRRIPVFRPSFSSDGRTLTSLFVGQQHWWQQAGAIVWDVETGTMLRYLKGGPVGGISGAGISPDGALLAWDRGYTVDLQEVTTGRIRHCLATGGLGSVATFSPDSKTLFAYYGYGSEDQLWDVQSGQALWKHPNNLYGGAAAFSPDGKTLALYPRYAGGGSMIRRRDVTTGKELAHPGGHQSAIEALGISADGRNVTTLDPGEQTLRQWEAVTGKELRRFTIPWGKAALSGDGQRVAVAYNDYRKDAVKIEIRDLRSTGAVRQLRITQASCDRLVFAPDGKTLVGRYEHRSDDRTSFVQLHDPATGKGGPRLAVPNGGSFQRLLCSPDGTMVASGWGNPRDPYLVYLWEASSGKRLRRLSLPTDLGIPALALSPDGRTLARLPWDFSKSPAAIELWETASGKERGRFPGVTRTECSGTLAFSPDGRVLAICGADEVIRLWSVRTGHLLGWLTGHQGEVRCLAFTPDGHNLISGSADTTALVWDVAPFVAQLRTPPIDLTDGQLEVHWRTLAGTDGVKAFQAIQALISAWQTVDWLQQRLQPAQDVTAKRLAQLAADLDDNTFEVRAKAAEELEQLGDLTKAALMQVMTNGPSLEHRRRVELLLAHLKPDGEPAPIELQRVRAVEVLEQIGTPAARRLLQRLAEGAPGARLTREAQAALKRLTVR